MLQSCHTIDSPVVFCICADLCRYRQLANAEKSVERAQMKARSERTGMSSYDNTWD